MESKFDLELKVQRDLPNLEDNFFDNIDIIQEINRTWNNLNEQKKSLKNKIDSNIKYIISFNNVSAKENIKEQITNNFDEEERKCFNKFRNNIEIFLRKKCIFAWDQIVRRLKEKIEGINSIILTYDYCQTKEIFKQEIENNYLNDNDRIIIINNTITNFRIVIDKCWKKLEIIKKEKSGQKKNLEMEKKIYEIWDSFFDFQKNLLMEQNKKIEKIKLDFEVKNKDLEEKENRIKESEKKLELEEEKKKEKKKTWKKKKKN